MLQTPIITPQFKVSLAGRHVLCLTIGLACCLSKIMPALNLGAKRVERAPILCAKNPENMIGSCIVHCLKKIFLAAVTLVALPVCAESQLGVSVSSDVVTLNYSHSSDNNSQWGVMGLYNDPLRASLIAANFNVVGQAGESSELYTGLGFKAAIYDTFETAGSLALGGSIEYSPSEWSGFGVQGQLYYAPSIFSTKDVDKYLDFLIRATYDVNAQAKVFLGWQSIEVGYEGGGSDIEIDKSFNLGFSLYF